MVMGQRRPWLRLGYGYTESSSTKVYLTVIALSLSVIAFKDNAPIQKAFAGEMEILKEVLKNQSMLKDMRFLVLNGIDTILMDLRE